MATEQEKEGPPLVGEAREFGEREDSIQIDISYRIIRQFSKQLYDNPRRAIEELVCNSYDANATECHISTPESEDDSLFVLDDGHSMNLDDLEWLWKVATSPKMQGPDDEREQGGRKQIGKFGVGKLASFALGRRLTYVATKEGVTRVVSVHQNRLRDDEEADDEFSVYQFPSEEAEERLGDYFHDVRNPWEEEWDTWTLAAISDILPENTGNDLQPWHLKNMIRTAIPVSTNFTAFLNREEIDERDPPGELLYTVDVTEEDVINELETDIRSYWAGEKGIDNEDVDDKLCDVETTTFPNPENTDEEIAGIRVPELGLVSGTGKLYSRSITTSKRKERGFQDNGFRVYVRGKLVNKRDHLFGIESQSHSAFSKFIGEFEMPDLDDEIRVHRNDFSKTHSLKLARTVAKRVFLNVRAEDRSRRSSSTGSTSSDNSDESLTTGSFSSRLKNRNQRYAFDAVAGLSGGLAETESRIEDIDLETRGLNPTDRAVSYDSEDNTVVINESHPLFDTLQQRDEFTEHIEDAFKEILAGRLLIHGYMRTKGANGTALAQSRQIFDSILRSAANNLGADEISYLLDELDEASTIGHARFEEAIVDIFDNIGLSAAQVGGADTHDGVIEIPQIGDNKRFSVEAKGSKGIITNKSVGLDDVNRHRVEADCQRAILVAREFKLDGIGDKKSALLRNLDEDINEEMVSKISLLTTDAIEIFLKLHDRQPFTYSEAIEILENDRVPGEITGFVREVWENKPDDKLARKVLEAAHDFMEKNPKNSPSIGALTADDRLWDEDREDITKRVESLSVLTNSVEMKGDDKFELDAPVDAIMQEVDEVKADASSVLEEDVGIDPEIEGNDSGVE